MYCPVISRTMGRRRSLTSSNLKSIQLSKPFQQVHFAAESSVDGQFLFQSNTQVVRFLVRVDSLGHVFRPVNPVAQCDRTRYGDEDEDEDEDIEKVQWSTAEKFESITVWKHHALPDETQDHWIRGVDEWIQMADVVCFLAVELTLDELSGI
jgi:hypothetical protein